MFLETLEQVGELKVCHICCRNIAATCLNQTLGKVLLKSLQVHDLVLNRVSHDQAEDIDCASLADTMSSIHSLQVVHRVPIVLHEYDDISASQCKTKATDGGCENKDSDRAIVVELIDSLDSISRTMLAKQTQVLDAKAIKDLLAYEFHARAHLAED